MQSQIDLVFVKGVGVKGKIKRLKLASDHLGLMVKVEESSEWSEVEIVVIDWDRVDVTLGVGKKEGEKDLKWYYKLKAESEYDKLLKFRGDHLKKIRLTVRSKRWWDEELSA